MSNFMYWYYPYARDAAAYAATNSGVWPTTQVASYTNANNAQTAVYNAMNNLSSGLVQGGCR
jgi:hypothetical protein